MVKNPAGFWVRLGASFVDGILCSIIIGCISGFVYGKFFTEGYTPLDSLETLYYLLIPVFWYGYTVGKRALGICIVRIDGGKVGIGTTLLRYVVAPLVYGLSLGICAIVSAFMVGLRKDKRSIHDFIAGTYVTYDSPDVPSTKGSDMI